MLARLFVIFGGLFVLALTAALVAPYFIDWSSYRAEFEREAGAILGRSVTVQGDATARLLPFPSVTFSDVAVGGGPGGKPAMTVEEFSMDAELAPFMRGEFLIFDMRLVRPKMNVSVDADGKVDWAMRPSSPFDPAQIAIEKLTITEGQVRISHATSGRDHLVSEINAEVSAKSLDGPWRADGSLRLDGMLTAIGLSTGKVDDKGALRLRIKADPAIYPVAIESDGDVTIERGAAKYAGTMHIEARDDTPAGAAGEQAQAASAKAKLPAWRVRGSFALDHARLALDTFRFETGTADDPYTADGSAYVALDANPRFSVTAAGAQVRFDEAIIADKDPAGLTFQDRIAAIRAALLDLPKPSIPGSIDVDLPAVVAGDTTIRDVRMQAEPAPDGWQVKTLSASLPGRTTLEASGLLRTGESDFGFAGSLLVAVGQPSGFAAWLSKDVDEAIRRLPAAGFKATVDLTTERQLFSGLELILGKAKFQGEIENSEPKDANPSMRVALTGNALDVDGLAAFSALFVSERGGARFADRDLDIKVKAGPVSASGLTAETVDAALRLHGGDLDVDRLAIGGLSGATISATGKIKDFAGKPEGNVDASIVGVDLAPAIDQLAAQYPANLLITQLDARAKSYPGLFEDAEIDFVGTAVRNDDGGSGVAISANGTAGGSKFALTISGDGSPEAIDRAPMKLNFSAENADSSALMALYGLPSLALGVAGSGQTTFTAEGAIATGLKSALDFTADDMQAGFEGDLRVADGEASGNGNVHVEAADLEPWLMTSGVSFPGMGMGTPVSLTASVDFAKGVLAVSNIAGEISDGPVSGNVNAEIKDGLPHLTGNLAVDAFDAAPVAAMLVGEPALQGAAGSWPTVPFQAKVATPLTADLDMTFGSVSAGIFGVLEDAQMHAALARDGVRLSGLSGKLDGGELTGLLEARNNDGTTLVSTQFKLAGADLGQVLDGSGLTGSGDITASLSASGKSVEALVASLSGSGAATVKDARIPGINPDAFPALLVGADRAGREIDAARTAAFAPGIVSAGTFVAPPAQIAFTVAAGVLRAPPVTLNSGTASVSAELKTEFGTGVVAAAGTVTYAAGDDAVAGSDPAVRFTIEGPLGAMSGKYDTEPLAQFLTQRALEREQARVEALQSALLEKQRLRREVRYYASLQFERDRAAELARKAAEEAAAEAKRKAEEEARAKAEAEARARAEAEQRDAEAKRQAEEAAKAQAEADAKAKAEADQRNAEVEAQLAIEAKRRAAAEHQRLKDEAAAKGRQARQAEDAAKAAAAAEEAARKADEATRVAEQERVKADEASGSTIERVPLPAPRDAPQSSGTLPGRFDPDAIGEFLKSLGN